MVWGEGIFARPRFFAAAIFRASEAGTPLVIFVMLPEIIILSPIVLP